MKIIWPSSCAHPCTTHVIFFVRQSHGVYVLGKLTKPGSQSRSPVACYKTPDLHLIHLFGCWTSPGIDCRFASHNFVSSQVPTLRISLRKPDAEFNPSIGRLICSDAEKVRKVKLSKSMPLAHVNGAIR
ncbi:hypothetical protein CEXT_594811, partial [Caerostris extrusa]